MLVELFTAYQTAIEGALEIAAILGYPDISRNTVTLPVAALIFTDADYARVTPAQAPIRRIGQVEPVGRSIRAALHLFAANERALLALLDSFHGAKMTVVSVTADNKSVRVTYGPTVRQPFDFDESQLRYVVATEILFNWSV